ncbi:glycoside hydrolase family 97 protein [Serratia microhaemolytica]|uniref:glycoside hydrolase family 97 protein n=1 Tax=Serratia microhaemolytica TaxID=2675110 RepID=UPI000FDED8E3|nr:glycoside hydrolase family 97 protein [Serratia microhaemolytica]
MHAKLVIFSCTMVATIVATGCDNSTSHHLNEKNHLTQHSSCDIRQQTASITSPDGKITFQLSNNPVKKEGITVLRYSVLLDNNEVVSPSELGITRNDGDFHQHLTLVSCSPTREVLVNYSMPQGAFSEINKKIHQVTYEFNNTNQQRMQLIVRAENHGVAFQYYFPDTQQGMFEIKKEWTQLALPIPQNGGVQIAQRYINSATGKDPKAQSFYFERTNDRAWPKLATVGQADTGEKFGFGLPLLLQTEVNQQSYWVFFHEAGFNGDYPAGRISSDTSGAVYRYEFPLDIEANGYYGPVNPQKQGLPWSTPWRYLIISNQLKPIVEQTTMNDLSASSQLTDSTWINYGRASWGWASNQAPQTSYQRHQDFVDLAATMGWPYAIIDANWDKMTDVNNNPVDIKELADYAAKKNVGLFVWVNSGTDQSNNNTSTPKGVLNDATIRQTWMKQLAAKGIKGLKVDIVESNKQQMITYMQEVLKDAADHHLLVTIHNWTPPRGWERSWPNLVGTEASITGGNFYGSNGARNDELVEMNTIIPFIRQPVGGLDYSPTMVSLNFHPWNPRRSTLTHELALPVIFQSGVQTMADTKTAYLGLSNVVLDYLKKLPNTWDETRYLDGYPGKYVVIARRKSNSWYIAAINGEITEISPSLNKDNDPSYQSPIGKSRDLILNLSQLNCSDHSNIQLIEDGINQQDVKISSVNWQSEWQTRLKPFGGFIMVIHGC